MAITVKHTKVSTIPDDADTSLVRPSDWNADHTLTGTIPIANGGTGAATANDGLNNLLPSQTGNNGKVLATDGTNATWTTNGSGDVVGPSSATDNAVARYDTTTGKLIQNSVTLIDDTGNASGILSQQFSNGSAVTLAAGKIWYDGSTGAWNAGMGNGNITQQIGEELFIYGKASAAITDSPLQIVYHTGTVGASGVITFAPTIAGITDENAIVGVATESIALNGFGRVTTFGVVRGITTNGAAFGETWADDDVIWYNPVTGNPTKVKPVAPNIKFQIGLVIKAGAGGSGSFQVALVQGTALGGTDSNVKLTSTTNGNILTYDGGNGYWKNTDLTAGTGISVGKSANGVLTVTNSSPNTYDPAAVAITGGTINGTTVGATTPAAGTFTTITGQTEVLKGTGSNLLLQSQTFTSANWTKTNTTVTGSATTAPDSTNTASKIVASVTNAQHGVNQGVTLTTALCTFSFYAKASEYTNIRIDITDNSTGDVFCDANLSAGTIGAVTSGGSWTNSSATITSAGNGWYRITLTSLRGAGSSPTPVIYLLNNAGSNSFAGNGTDGVFVWGSQIELGSTANTYIPTTTTAIYGTPTLSFSGVAGLGLESNGSLYVSPAGTGALQAQATTSTTVGGNARGANAVDWQTSRSAASNVASGQYAVIGGGGQNTATTTYSAVFSGLANTASNLVSVVAGGQSNVSSGYLGFVGGGISNTAGARDNSSVVGGQSNTAGGFYNFIGGGFTNSGTSASAVTTQSGTMNATTAVTLSGSNANIKVGQLITGTSISSYTYVAAISGTALTLSQAASGSSTSTLSFYTPHGVVVGGGNNQATGSYSFIGGGGDAGTAANRNVASGAWSFVGGGIKNTASGIGSVVAGGGTDGTSAFANTASGTVSTISGGWNNTASGLWATIAGGQSHVVSGSLASIGGGTNNTADGSSSTVVGGAYGTTRAIAGNIVFPACNQAIASSNGVTQAALLLLAVQTTDATATALRSNTSAASGTNQVILPNNSAYFFTGEVVSGKTAGGDTKGWTIEGVIKRGANAASTALVGTPTVTSLYGDAGAATWVIAVTADTTNGGIRVTFTGQAATTIRTVCQIRTTEMTY